MWLCILVHLYRSASWGCTEHLRLSHFFPLVFLPQTSLQTTHTFLSFTSTSLEKIILFYSFCTHMEPFSQLLSIIWNNSIQRETTCFTKLPILLRYLFNILLYKELNSWELQSSQGALQPRIQEGKVAWHGSVWLHSCFSWSTFGLTKKKRIFWKQSLPLAFRREKGLSCSSFSTFFQGALGKHGCFSVAKIWKHPVLLNIHFGDFALQNTDRRKGKRSMLLKKSSHEGRGGKGIPVGGCPGRPWSVPLRTHSCVTCSRTPCLGRGLDWISPKVPSNTNSSVILCAGSITHAA